MTMAGASKIPSIESLFRVEPFAYSILALSFDDLGNPLPLSVAREEDDFPGLLYDYLAQGTAREIVPCIHIREMIYQMAGHLPRTRHRSLKYMRPGSRTQCIPPLNQTVAKYLLFYFKELKPYLLSSSRKDRTAALEKIMRREGWDGMAHGYDGTGGRDSFGYGGSAHPFLMFFTHPVTYLNTRWKAGLARKEQFEMIIVAFEATLNQVKAMMRRNAGVEEIAEGVGQGQHIIAWFTDLRSHRMELLLLKYLREESVDWDVVDAVEMEERERLRTLWRSFLGKEKWAGRESYIVVRFGHWRATWPTTDWSTDDTSIIYH
ncbi:hypothetical protein BJ508DRAFT_110549 [Ascobolus immersus RN42]|uniref:Uncharacterized protein n=1 Tax=Ascobolus immersus RN42 TaxID=1160509 RepID=A0A3N4HG38_ASCIM|nr:hypothetical protein BJ508DRAFT_110549 [Ascobolus immersus RN42]